MVDDKAKNSGTTEAFLLGWLKEVNWAKRTAQLHRLGSKYVRLRFKPALDDEMARFANQYVEVRGQGRFNEQDEWKSVDIHHIEGERRSCWEPFDLEAFLNDPNRKVFDPDKLVTASEPFDVDEFIRIIHEGRDVGMRKSES